MPRTNCRGIGEPRPHTFIEQLLWGQILVARNANKVDHTIPVLEEFTATFLSPMNGSESNK